MLGSYPIDIGIAVFVQNVFEPVCRIYPALIVVGAEIDAVKVLMAFKCFQHRRLIDTVHCDI